MQIILSDRRDLPRDQVLDLYLANDWSSAKKPEKLLPALRDSHSLISAWIGERLVGLGNAISDGHLVVYYPHLLVHPDYQGKGIGKLILGRMQEIYGEFHMQMLTADGKAIDFYGRNGFEKAGETQAMWVYEGGEH
ncbi:MAG: GNAT family N-acetyltransferase [Bacteroidota bacterium]